MEGLVQRGESFYQRATDAFFSARGGLDSLPYTEQSVSSHVSTWKRVSRSVSTQPISVICVRSLGRIAATSSRASD